MLIQSHAGEIQLLPALPAAWPTGSVKGIRARGGFEVDMSWENGELKAVTVHSLNGNPCKVSYGKRTWKSKTQKGNSYSLNNRLKISK